MSVMALRISGILSVVRSSLKPFTVLPAPTPQQKAGRHVGLHFIGELGPRVPWVVGSKREIDVVFVPQPLGDGHVVGLSSRLSATAAAVSSATAFWSPPTTTTR